MIVSVTQSMPVPGTPHMPSKVVFVSIFLAAAVWANQLLPPTACMRACTTLRFSGHRILVVDKADNSRSSLALFLAKLQSHLDGQKATAVASGTPWTDPQVRRKCRAFVSEAPAFSNCTFGFYGSCVTAW